MASAVVVVIFTVQQERLSVLLIERAAAPARGEWALPGGVLREGESLDGAAARKLADETGVSDVFLEQLYTFDRLGDGRAEVVVTYFALVDVAQVRLRTDLEWRPAWQPVRALPPLAFENERVVRYAEERLRSKLEYTNVVYSLLPAPLRNRDVQAVGRLDEDTTGLLLLTDDGQLIHKLTSPKHHVPKVYDLGCAEAATEKQVRQLLEGVMLNDERTPVRAAGCEITGERQMRLTLTEGKYHQVKRMLAAVGNSVTSLHRSAFGALTLPADLAPGQWRWLDGPQVLYNK